MRRFSLKNKLSILLSTGLLSGVPLLPLSTFAGTTKQAWQCKPDANGQWDCSGFQENVGPVFNARILSDSPPPKEPAPHLPAQHQKPAKSNHAKQLVAAEEKKPEKSLPSALDWVPLDQLPPSFPITQRTLLCRGTYVEPEWPGLHFTGDADNAQIKANADRYDYKTQGDGILTGHVQIEQGNRLIKSQFADLDQARNLASVKGNVIIRQPGILVTGRSGNINTKTNEARISDAQYVLQKQHVRGSALQAHRNATGVIDLDQATYTTAPPGNNAWIFSAKKMTLNPEDGRGEASDATLRFSGIPVFYTPYINFPIDSRRKSGLLYPSLSFGGNNGAEYIQPFYLNIAPDIDDTLTPRLMSSRGLMMSNQFRYLRPDFQGEFGGSFLAGKDPVKNDNPYYDRSRWFLFWKHHQNLTENWDVNVDYSKAGDKNFIRDFGVNDWSFDKTNPLVQEMRSRYQGGRETDHPWSLAVKMQQLQNMSISNNDPYNRLPEVTLRGLWSVTEGMEASYHLDYTRFERARDWMYTGTETIDQSHGIYRYNYGPGTGLNNAEGGRMVMQGKLKYRTDKAYGFWETGLGYRGILYNLENLDLAEVQSSLHDTTLDRNDIEHPHTFAPTFYSGGGLYFDRAFSFLRNSYTQTLEPRIQYVFTPYVDNQERNPAFDTGTAGFNINSLWNTDRFNGYDRLGDTNHIALGVTTRVIDEQGFENFRFGIGQSFYLQDRKVFLDPEMIENDTNNNSNTSQAKQRILDNYRSPVSPLATQMIWNPGKDWSLQQDYTYNTRYHYTDQYHLGLSWKPEKQSVFNVGYRYISQPDRVVYTREGNATSNYADGDLNVAEASFALPLSTRNSCGSWQLLGLWSHDLANKRDLTRMLGIQNDTCSYRVRLVYRSYVDPLEHVETAVQKRGIFLQFVLKGLGNITGSQVDTYLEDIKGYKPEYEND